MTTTPATTTPHYERLIAATGGESGPLARMVRPAPGGEPPPAPGESADPIGDALHARAAGGRLVHRYPDRAILLVTTRCAAACRFCFRRAKPDFPSPDIPDRDLDDACAYLAGHPGILEVILSGGDPLSLPDSRLEEIVAALRAAARGSLSVRLHTRYPVYDPGRCARLAPVAARFDAIVTHVNCAPEVDPHFRRAAAEMRAAPLLLNQSALLRGVNDTPQALAALSRALGAAGITPYYLHLLDPAPGTARFRVPLREAMALAASLRGVLPGYLIPRLALDLPGGRGKVILGEDAPEPRPDGSYIFRSPIDGGPVLYVEPDAGARAGPEPRAPPAG